MRCPLCSFELDDFTPAAECPKCHGKGIPKPVSAPPQSPAPMPYNPTIPRPAPEPPRQGMSPVAIGALVLVPVVAIFAALNFFGMEIKPKGGKVPVAVATSAPFVAPTLSPVVPVVAPTVASETETPKSSPRPRSPQPRESEPMATGALPVGKGQSFGDYSTKTLALIDATENSRQLSRIGLDLYAMSAEADREKERAQVSGGRISMWGYASALFESLGNGAAAKVKFLDGRTFPQAYRAESRGRDYACAQYARAADSVRPKIAQEQEGERILKGLRQKTAPQF